MTWHVAAAAGGGSAGDHGPDVLGGRRQPERFQDAASLDAHGGDVGVEVTPLLTVGDVLPSGYRYEAIPDGISVRTRGQGRVDLFVNHETSKVPFPYNTAAPTAVNGQSDFDNSQVSRLILNQHSAGVLNGSFVIPSSAGFQRFCSNYLATSREDSTGRSCSRTRSRPTIHPTRGFVAARHG